MADKRGIGMSKRVKEEGSSSHQAEENNQTLEENVRFLDLPENIDINILSRLPLNKIFQFKSVSKTFSKILSDPYFSEVHLTVSPKTTPALIVVQDEDHVSMSILDLDQASPTTSSSINASTSTTDLSFQNVLTAHSFSTRRNVKLSSLVSYESSDDDDDDDMMTTVVDSCNGLVCYYYTFPEPSTESTYFVCNPLLAEYITLPPPTPSTPDYTYLDHSGFGFCPTSKTYKVIRCMNRKSVDSNMVETWTHVAEIHTLGTKSWRSIPGPHRLPQSDASFDAHLNGNLHWITYGYENPSEIICSFDLHTEKFGVIPPPPHFIRDYKENICGIKIGSLKGSLCLTYVSEEDQFTVWVMNKYGVKESWTKHFSIDVMLYADLRVEDFNRPVKFSDDGDIWFLTRLDSLVSYSPENKSFKEVSKLGSEWWITRVIPHVPSLVSLRNAVAVDKDLEAEGGITIQNMGSFNSLVMQGNPIESP